MLGVDGFVLPGLLPPIATDLSVSVATAGQLTTAFAITYAIGSPVIATVTGHLDRRVVIGAGMVTFLVGMLLQAVGTTYAFVLVGRVVAALGAAAFQANAFAVAGVLARPERRARSFAMIGAGSSLASVLGVPLGLAIGQWLGWRGTMWAIVLLGVAAAVLAAVGVPSVTLPATTLRSRLRVLVTPRILVLLVVSALVLAPTYLVITYTAAIVGTGASLVALFVNGAGFFLGNRLAGRYVDRFPPLATLMVALTAMAGVTVALSVVAHWLVPTLVALFALGLVASFLFIPQQSRVFVAGGDHAAVALSLNGSMNYVGAAVGTAVGGVVLATAGPFWLAPVAAGITVVVAGVTWVTRA
ncbi:MFS transporter [Kibdelosporangium lantanae]